MSPAVRLLRTLAWYLFNSSTELQLFLLSSVASEEYFIIQTSVFTFNNVKRARVYFLFRNTIELWTYSCATSRLQFENIWNWIDNWSYHHKLEPNYKNREIGELRSLYYFLEGLKVWILIANTFRNGNLLMEWWCIVK